MKIDSYFARKIPRGSGYDFIQGWAFDETPSLIANSSDREVTVPGRMKPHSVAVHPSPGLMVSIGWRSPISGRVRVAPTVSDAHGRLRQRRHLVAGAAGGAPTGDWPPAPPSTTARRRRSRRSTTSPFRPGTCSRSGLVRAPQPRLPTSPRSTWRSTCPATRPVGGNSPRTSPATSWPATRTPIRSASRRSWHFYTEPADDRSGRPVVPSGSLLARWLEASPAAEKARLAGEIQRLLTSANPTAGKDKDSPDAVLARQANSLDGPLLGPIAAAARAEKGGLSRAKSKAADAGPSPIGASIPGCSAMLRMAGPSTRRASASRRRRSWRSACRPTWSPVANSS